MKIYIMRHGRTSWNEHLKIQGQKDIELNDVGRKQADEARKKFNALDIDLIICSPLKRTVETAKIINKDKNVEVIYDCSLMERNLGEFEGQKLCMEPSNIYNINLNVETHNIESVKMLCDRVYNLLDNIKNNYSNRKILLITHGGTTRAIESYFLGVKEDGNLPPEDLENCEIREYSFKE